MRKDLYSNIKLLNEGSYGEVFKVRENDSGKIYALKRVNIEYTRNNSVKNSLEREL